MVLADSYKASPTSQYSGYRYNNQAYANGTITLYGSTFQYSYASIDCLKTGPTTPRRP